jgi:TrmH family RNA methyltransferase
MTPQIRNRRNPVVRRLRVLGRERKAREAKGAVALEGVRLLEEALAAGLALGDVLVSPALERKARGRAILGALRERGASPVEATDEVLRWAASTETPQGVVASASRPASGPVPVEGGELLLVLAGVQDPGNVGTVARTAEAAGAAGLLLLPGTADAWGPKALRAAAGSLFRLPVESVPWEAARDRLRGAGIALVGADSASGAPHTGHDWTRGSALVLGSEGAGVPEEVRPDLDAAVRVPTRGVESLNVAAAAAVILFEAARQRGFPGS